VSVFAVLLVCSGNQCRSAAAEVTLRSFLSALGVSSAGAGLGSVYEPAFEAASAGTAVPLPTTALGPRNATPVGARGGGRSRVAGLGGGSAQDGVGTGSGAHRAVGAVGRGMSSAGMLGRPMHPLTVQALAAAGFDAPPHVAQPLTSDLVGAADLVLTAERRHRAAVVEADPGGDAARRTFTMLEFARVAADLAGSYDALNAPMSPSDLVARVAAARVSMPATVQDDIPDPVSQPLAAHQQMVDVVATAMRTVAEVLAAS
jgi:protein-tyrosine phosphatase